MPEILARHTKMGLLFLTLAASVVASACGLSRPAKTWPVVVHHAGKAHTLQVPEDTTVLAAVEIAGLLPGSECRRGRCLSCAARVVAGEPFSLRVASDTALCEAAHTQGLVLLCSAFACGPGLELELGLEGEAWDIQHRERWTSDFVLPPPAEGVAPCHYRMPEDVATFLERCRNAPCSTPSPTAAEQQQDPE